MLTDFGFVVLVIFSPAPAEVSHWGHDTSQDPLGCSVGRFGMWGWLRNRDPGHHRSACNDRSGGGHYSRTDNHHLGSRDHRRACDHRGTYHHDPTNHHDRGASHHDPTNYNRDTYHHDRDASHHRPTYHHDRGASHHDTAATEL